MNSQCRIDTSWHYLIHGSYNKFWILAIKETWISLIQLWCLVELSRTAILELHKNETWKILLTSLNIYLMNKVAIKHDSIEMVQCMNFIWEILTMANYYVHADLLYIEKSQSWWLYIIIYLHVVQFKEE